MQRVPESRATHAKTMGSSSAIASASLLPCLPPVASEGATDVPPILTVPGPTIRRECKNAVAVALARAWLTSPA
jgi:hypothetical protein